jgi:plastocyanin domain-containing protein
MLREGGGWQVPGIVLTLVGLGAIPAILWWVLKRWPGGKLAAVTNAAEA